MNKKIGDVTTKGGHKYTVTDIDPETGAISWSVENSPSLDKSFDLYKKLLLDFKSTLTQLDDPILTNLYTDLKQLFNKFRLHLRKNYPEQYKKMVQEVSTSAGAGSYSSKYAFKLPKNNPGSKLGKGPKASQEGVKNNVYTKSWGYKLVDRKKQANKSQSTDYKDLWGKTYK